MRCLLHPILGLTLAVALAGCGGDAETASQQPETGPGTTPASSAPIGIGPCEGARPGAAVLTANSQCTLGFVFRDGSGVEYIGTAGHCVLGDSPFGGEDSGERVWPGDSGPEARDADGQLIGHYAYAVLSPPKDFALIRVANGVATNAQSCHFGGPDGINNERSAQPSVLRYYGSGLAVGDLVPARSALALSMRDPDALALTGVAAPGDSGAGVLDRQGKAVGVLVTVGLILSDVSTEGIDAGTIGVTRLPPQLQRARQALGRPGVELVTAP